MSEVVIAVAELEYGKAQRLFEETSQRGMLCFQAPREETGLVEAIRQRGATHAILGVDKYTGPLYEVLPKGSVLARFGVGYDGLDLPRATRHGLLCTNTPGVLDVSVAEHALALILAAVRRLPVLHARTLDDIWEPKVGMELRGKRLAVIGCGPIGRQLAKMASFGLGMEVAGCEIADVDAGAMKGEFGFASITPDFAEAVREAHIVTLHIPSIPATRHFLNAERLKQIPAEAWLVNTARGAVVDEVALFEALSAGQLAGAALDVFEAEPYVPAEPDKDLRRLPNVVLTPHVASSTQEACDRMGRGALRNISLAIEGRFDEMNLLNPEVLKT
jgi:phosphoglycerate dehydrogenase-like enzyme